MNRQASGSPANPIRKATAKDLDRLKDDITKFWEECTMPELIERMKEKHGLSATKRQYERRIEIWGLNKKINGKEMKFLVKERAKRKLRDKDSKFRVRGQPVEPTKLDRFLREKKLTDEQILSAPSPVMSNADIISVFTPSDAGSPPPSPFLNDVEEIRRYSPSPSAAVRYTSPTLSPDPPRVASDLSGQSVDLDFSKLFITDPDDRQKALAELGSPASLQNRYLREDEVRYMDLLMDSEKKWGRDGERTLNILAKFSSVLCRQWRVYASQMVYQRVLWHKLHHFGPRNPDTMHALYVMGRRLLSQGKIDIALKLAQYIDTHSSSDNIKAYALDIKIRVFFISQQWEAAEISAKQLRLINQQPATYQAPDSPYSLGQTRILIDILIRVHKSDEAIELASGTLEMASHSSAEWEILDIQRSLSMALQSANRLFVFASHVSTSHGLRTSHMERYLQYWGKQIA